MNESAINKISTLHILGIAFVILKLCKVIDWHWGWVTLPFWGPLAFLLLIFISVLIAALVFSLVESFNGKT